MHAPKAVNRRKSSSGCQSGPEPFVNATVPYTVLLYHHSAKASSSIGCLKTHRHVDIGCVCEDGDTFHSGRPAGQVPSCCCQAQCSVFTFTETQHSPERDDNATRARLQRFWMPDVCKRPLTYHVVWRISDTGFVETPRYTLRSCKNPIRQPTPPIHHSRWRRTHTCALHSAKKGNDLLTSRCNCAGLTLVGR